MINGIIRINNIVFNSLFAISNREQRTGLMNRDPPFPIMSFVYYKPQVNKMWMSNTRAPLDIVFCFNGNVSQICYGEPMSTSLIGNNEYSDLIIELPFGTAKDFKIKIGDSVEFIKPTHDEIKMLILQMTI